MAGSKRTAGVPVARAQDQLAAPGRAWEKYADLIVGRRGLWPLLRYELVLWCAHGVPGALGLLLRQRLYRWLLGSCGRQVVFGQHVTVRHPHKIHIGDGVVIDDHCLLDAKGDTNAGIRIGDGVFIGRNTILSCKNGDIVLGAGVNIGFNCEVFSASRVEIGAQTLLAAYSYVIGGDHAPGDPSQPVQAQPRVSRGIAIGAGAWVGAGAKVFDGIHIGDGAIVGAGAVVNRDVPARAVAVGVPARVVSTRE